MILFLYGQDSYRSYQKLIQLRTRYVSEVDTTATSIHTIEGDAIDLGYIRQGVLAQGLFATRRFVIFKNIVSSSIPPSLQAELVELLQQQQTDTQGNIIVFWEQDAVKLTSRKKEATALYTFLKELPYAQEFTPLPLPKQIRFIQEYVSQRGGSITPDAARLLATVIETDTWRLVTELDKICAYANKNQITSDTIALLVNTVTEQEIFGLLDAITAQSLPAVLRQLHAVCTSPADVQPVFAMLKWYTTVLVGIAYAYADGIGDQAMIAQMLSIHPFVVKKNSARARQLLPAQCDALLISIGQLEMLLRTNSEQGLAYLTQQIMQMSTT